MEEVGNSSHEVTTPNARAREGKRLTGKRKRIDWEGIKREYRAGQCSIRIISQVYGCSHVAISKKAKKEGWTRDLTERVQQEVQNNLLRTPHARENDETIVQEAGKIGADVVREHRQSISDSNDMFELMMGELKAISLSLDEIEAWIIDETEDAKGNVEADKRRRMMDAISLPSRTAAMRNLVQSLSQLIRLEREAFNLDKGDDGVKAHEDYDDFDD